MQNGGCIVQNPKWEVRDFAVKCTRNALEVARGVMGVYEVQGEMTWYMAGSASSPCTHTPSGNTSTVPVMGNTLTSTTQNVNTGSTVVSLTWQNGASDVEVKVVAVAGSDDGKILGVGGTTGFCAGG